MSEINKSREVQLPSGATLRIALSPFAESKNLYQAMLREIQKIEVSVKMEMGDLCKNLFCAGFSSPEIEALLWKCFERCAYRGPKVGDQFMKIDTDTFEPADARADYFSVCVEVAQDNVDPFMKALIAKFKLALAMMQNTQKSQ